MDHITTGQIGEELAKKYLEGKGYKIIERNFKTKYAEIDLVGIKQGILIFFEVRTKRGEIFGSPEDTLDHSKLRKVSANAQVYVAFKKWCGPCRVDAICIILGGDDKAKRIDHYENIVS